MENLNFILFISMAAPLAMFLFMFKDRVRTVFAFLLLGLVMCLLAGEINGLLINSIDKSQYYYTINIAPVIEEILKALPILVYVFLYKPSKKDLLMCSMVIGIGFAILENAYILGRNASYANIITAIFRGFGAGMMHAICTSMIGYGLSYIEKDRRLAIAGTFSLLAVAIIYHSTYNCIVQSSVQLLGILLPLVTFVPIAIVLRNKKTLK